MTKEDQYDNVLELRSKGLNYCEIARQTGINRTTLMGWCKGIVDKTKLKHKSNCKVDDVTFSKYVKDSFSVAEVLRKSDLKPRGANYRGFHNRVKVLCLDTSHFTGQGHLKGKSNPYVSELTIEETFVIDGHASSTLLRNKILKYNLLEYRCVECSLMMWRDKPIALHLDHIDGDNRNNLLTNLRFLCPNCHSQTSTYCGKNKGINQ